MRYKNTPLKEDGIKEKVFQKEIDNVLITIAMAIINPDEYFCGVSVQSPKEKKYNNKKRAYAIARGRLRKAINEKREYIFPKQRWLSMQRLKSIIDNYSRQNLLREYSQMS